MNSCDHCGRRPLGFPVDGLCHECEAKATAVREDADAQRRNLAVIRFLMDNALPAPRTPQPDCASRLRTHYGSGPRRRHQ